MRGVPFHNGPNGTPILDDSLAYLECRVREVFDGGDHDIFLGEAMGGEVVRPEDPPLVFFRGSYRDLS